MKKNKWLKILLTVLYITGIGCHLVLLLTMCLHPHRVASPDAMLPMTDFERAFVMMAAGFIPMAGSALSLVWVYDLKNTAHRQRNMILALLPAAVDAVPFVFMAGLVLVMLAEAWLEVFGLIH